MAMSEEEYWENQANEQFHTSLTRVRAAATAWLGTISTMIGLFGVVAIVTGPDAIAEFGDGVQVLLLVVILLALGAAVFAVVETALAAQGVPKTLRPLTGLKLAKWTRDETGTAKGRLERGRLTGIAAGILVAVAGVIALSATTFAPGAGINTLVKTRDGQIQCGQLEREDDGSIDLTFGSESMDLDTGIKSATVVDACP